MSRITLITDGGSREAEFHRGESLLSVLQRVGAGLSAPCGGNGTCGKCRVDVARAGAWERALACKTPAEEGMSVRLPESAAAAICDTGIADGGYAPDGAGLGAAVDVGTTTVALQLLDRATGRVLATRSELNAQRPFGADVLSRVLYTMERDDGPETLRRCVGEQTERLLSEACAEAGVDPAGVERFVAGNTVMQHIAAGLSPASIAVAPFTPATLFEEDIPRDGVGYAPCVAGYVGGDITAGLLAAGLCRKEKPTLFIDLGTNGEMALGDKHGVVCCAVASGPAFEGAGISCGMAGTAGAISHVAWENGKFALTVIGGGAPRGLCGSGLIELTARLLELGILDDSGYLQGPEDAGSDFGGMLTEDEDGNGLVTLTEDGSVYFTARDARQLQLAKAAVAAGIDILLSEVGLCAEDVAELYLAGGFGTYIDAGSAAALGMLPPGLVSRTRAVGNSSLTGAALALCSSEARRELFAIPARCRYVELSGDRRFNERFAERMAFTND